MSVDLFFFRAKTKRKQNVLSRSSERVSSVNFVKTLLIQWLVVYKKFKLFYVSTVLTQLCPWEYVVTIKFIHNGKCFPLTPLNRHTVIGNFCYRFKGNIWQLTFSVPYRVMWLTLGYNITKFPSHMRRISHWCTPVPIHVTCLGPPQ